MMCGSGHALWLLTRVTVKRFVGSSGQDLTCSGHTSAAKALTWCPFRSNLLAFGGGEEDRKIKFWNTQTGACLNSVDTGSSQVSDKVYLSRNWG
ncbi:hypothetical protein Bca52824_060487 [Brassica carinata]|uniref:Uncharacterized protein n=1 Tax=Brassica carinata TaxID=52824 RepID=A0A8X7QXZ6_BRACI|nr:hypothetical protein Bca52824_060487 [Brassica carinata]